MEPAQSSVRHPLRPDPPPEGSNEEAEKIRAILKQYPQNRLEAARALRMSRTTLWRKMKKYGIIDA